MLRKSISSIAAAALLAGSAAAQKSDTPALSVAVKSAIDRGELLYIYDRAAWLGSDDFLGRYANLSGKAGGYVVTGDEAVELVFYDKSKATALYRATFHRGSLTKSGPPTRDRIALTPLEIQMIAAKDRALSAFMSANVGLCAKANPNLAVLPPERPNGPTIVYLMTPQTDLEAYPLGGHYSVEVHPDGSVGKVRRFTKSCIAMSKSDVPKGSEPLAFGITHLLDPTPTEIHVFTSLASKTPIYVSTSKNRIWSVDGNTIRTVSGKR